MDRQQAYYWFKQASVQGHVGATEALQNINLIAR